MFASLKNKIREETGNDLSKLTSKITTSTAQRIDSLRGRSHHGSSSSINSIPSSDGLDASEDYKRRLAKLEVDFVKKLDHKESEWRDIVNDKDVHIQNLQREKDEALKQVARLRDSLKSTEEVKQKLVEHQEDKDQIESLQSQELSKVKQLVLLREQELAEKTAMCKQATTQLEKMRGEVARLRRQEEQLSDVQDDLEALRHSSARDLATLATNLAKCEEERRHLSDLVVVLRQRLSNETSHDEQITSERQLLEQRLEEAHLQLADIKTSWSDKIAALETQVGRLSRQAAEEGSERRIAVQEREKLAEKVRQMEAELECNLLELQNKETKIKRLTTDVEEMSKELKLLRQENEEEVTFLRTHLQNAQTEVKIVRKNLENTECQLDRTSEECSKLKLASESDHEASNSLRQLITKLEKELSEEKSNCLNVQKTLTRVTAEKNTALLRNAEISQQMELIRQEKKRQFHELEDAVMKLRDVEEDNKQLKARKEVEEQLRNSVAQMEEQLMEKNKSIKTLQLRLADMKKTLQQELKSDNSAAILNPSQMVMKNFPSSVRRDEDDVNFKYLKHVVIKFLTSREYEAQHLTKALATLLKFTEEEERLVHDTLEWKRSWFGSKPKLNGSAQKSKTMPPS